MLQTLRKDNLSRWHSQRQVQDCYEWCFWSLPKMPDVISESYRSWHPHDCLINHRNDGRERPTNVFRSDGRERALCSVQIVRYVSLRFSIWSKKLVLNLWTLWIKTWCVLWSRKGKNRKAKLRQSTRADTEITALILHCSASLNKIILQDAQIRDLHLQILRIKWII